MRDAHRPQRSPRPSAAAYKARSRAVICVLRMAYDAAVRKTHEPRRHYMRKIIKLPLYVVSLIVCVVIGMAFMPYVLWFETYGR